MSNGDGHGVMLDPSFALSGEGAAFLSEGAEGEIERLAVSRSFVEALDSGYVPAWFSEAGPTIDPLFLREVLSGARLFSHEEAEVEEPRVAEVRDALLGELSPVVGEILADQWVFLQTQSWIASKLRHSFEAMAERGADMRELPGKAGRAVLAKTLKKKDLPERIPLSMVARAGAKWFAVGGSAVSSLVAPPVAVGLGTATGAFLLLDP